MVYHKVCQICGKEFDTTRPQQVICTLPHPKTCKYCGEVFYVDGEHRNKQYCSKKCKVSDAPMKKCVICGKMFHPTLSSQVACGDNHYKTCPVCGKQFKVNGHNYTKVCCSKKCRGVHDKQTGAFKEAAKKAKQTCLDRYGVDSYSKTQEYHDKVRETSLERFGVEHPGMSEQVVQHRKATMLERYGVEYSSQIEELKESKKQHQTETYLQKYGVDHPWKLKEVRDKSDKTKLERYGTVYPLQNEQLKEKARQTCIRKFGADNYRKSETGKRRLREIWTERYGVDNPFKSDIIKERIRKTNIRKYGVSSPCQDKEISKRQMSHVKETCLKKYGVPWPCMSPNCVASHSNISKLNVTYANELRNIGFTVNYEKHIDDRSYDMEIVGTNILLEIDPTYTHNSYAIPFGNHKGKDTNYHLNKSKLAESYGYRCIHVWDWDDWDKVLHILPTRRTRIGARMCYVVKLKQSDVRPFLNKYHLQGSCIGQKWCYGIVYKNSLVGVMTFGKPRYNKKFEWELLRLCFRSDVEIAGGSEKLFKRFVSEVSPRSIVSYCDNSKFTGNVYKRLGMELADYGKPGKHWYSNRKSEKFQHITDSLLRQQGFDRLFGTNYGKGTSNEQLMLQRKYLPVYDCGQSRYEWYAS